MSTLVPVTWMQMRVKRKTYHHSLNKPTKVKVVCSWQGHDVKLLPSPVLDLSEVAGLFSLLSYNVGDIILVSGDLTTTPRIKRNRKAVLQLSLVVAEVKSTTKVNDGQRRFTDDGRSASFEGLSNNYGAEKGLVSNGSDRFSDSTYRQGRPGSPGSFGADGYIYYSTGGPIRPTAVGLGSLGGSGASGDSDMQPDLIDCFNSD
ncbi:hypothetical protein BGZ51_008222 [Haplosporangium sp. Z 767]|nr:hypothetical protein BGZ50_008488 [Haplosporangium sp. Z 11]KAF9177990.1 hypothetical protein BGZ51_008222 [Haplosporangium sp. Z 767]